MIARRDLALFAVVGLLGLLALSGDSYLLRLATFACMYAVMSSSWNVIGGLAGYPSFATAAFFGLGAYAGGVTLAQGGPQQIARGKGL